MKLFNFITKLVASVIIGNVIFAVCSENTNTNQLTNKNTSLEKAKINSKIFLVAKDLKYPSNKKKKLSKKKANFLQNTEAIKKVQTEKTAEKTAENTKQGNGDVETKGPILHHGWIKYFKYSDGAINAPLPKGFEYNREFDEQKKYHRDEDYKQRNVDGTYSYIRDRNYFYLHLFENVVTIISSREVLLIIYL